mmetsp:Transcript_19483/g.28855  ORF Transcript_19483/g.28855 Transcript_19483/m.28855 type:complete len:83 (+) Transcript_19483:67-315(+)
MSTAHSLHNCHESSQIKKANHSNKRYLDVSECIHKKHNTNRYFGPIPPPPTKSVWISGAVYETRGCTPSDESEDFNLEMEMQ